MNLVFDLDGTLIHYINDGNYLPTPIARPNLKSLLQTSFELCNNVSIWTLASQKWLNKCLDQIIYPRLNSSQKFKYLYTEKNCVHKYNNDLMMYQNVTIYKPLKKLWKKPNFYKPYNTIIIEDTPSNCVKNFDNMIIVESWNGDLNDTELYHLEEYLKNINSEKENIDYFNVDKFFDVRIYMRKNPYKNNLLTTY